MRIEIETDFIKLDQLLKFSTVVDSGGVAKVFIADGFVAVNDETCTMRGKKIKAGDRVSVYIPDEEGNISEVIELDIVKKG